MSDATAETPAEPQLDDVVAEWTNVPDLAEALGVELFAVRQMIKDGNIVAVKRNGVQSIPALIVSNHDARRFLPGIITLMRDGNYSDAEIVRWLYTPDETLVGGSCAGALAAGHGTEIRRRAHAAAL